MDTALISVPRMDEARVVVPAPSGGPGNWAGAPSAYLDGDQWVLAYRVRRPVGAGRGVATIVAVSHDGFNFRAVAELRRTNFGAESFERPAILRRPDGGWRLYLSCATPDSKHWWIEAVDADELSHLSRGRRRVVLAGSRSVAVKDPVVTITDGVWEMWACEHPLDEVGAEDRMTTAYLTSADGLAWERQGTALSPTPGTWDARGARLTAVVSRDPFVVLYDGRPRAEDNWFETTGMASGSAEALAASTDGPVATSPHADGALRYACAVALPDGGTRFYFEAARPDGAHDLMTALA